MPVDRRQPTPDLVVAGIDLRDVSDCTCLRLRKATRRVTQIYETCLEPAALTIGQFGVLATLKGFRAIGMPGLSMGMLAERLGVDPTTLKRTLSPLLRNHLVAADVASEDRRMRIVALTELGSERLTAALPLWRRAQDTLRDRLGAGIHVALDHAVDDAYAKIAIDP